MISECRERVSSGPIDWSRPLPYLEACIKEAMRLFPAGPVSNRVNTEPCMIGPHRIPGRKYNRAKTKLQVLNKEYIFEFYYIPCRYP